MTALRGPFFDEQVSAVRAQEHLVATAAESPYWYDYLRRHHARDVLEGPTRDLWDAVEAALGAGAPHDREALCLVVPALSELLSRPERPFRAEVAWWLTALRDYQRKRLLRRALRAALRHEGSAEDARYAAVRALVELW